jgi:hypothetical protein
MREQYLVGESLSVRDLISRKEEQRAREGRKGVRSDEGAVFASRIFVGSGFDFTQRGAKGT